VNMKRKEDIGILCLKWLLASVLGWAMTCGTLPTLVWVLGAVPTWIPERYISQLENGLPSAFGGALFMAVIGAWVGIWPGMAQEFALHRWISFRRRWMLANTLGWAVELGMAWFVYSLGYLYFDWVDEDSLFLAGLVAGWAWAMITQWFVLRRQVYQPTRWVIVSAANMVASAFVTFIVTLPALVLAGWSYGERTIGPKDLVAGLTVVGFIGGALGGIVSGVIAGLLLIILCYGSLEGKAS
jgi:hypothetical protein